MFEIRLDDDEKKEDPGKEKADGGKKRDKVRNGRHKSAPLFLFISLTLC